MNSQQRPPPPPPSFITAADERLRKAARPALREASAINVERIDRNINESLRKQIVDIINKNPDFALAVLRSWKDR